MRPEAWDALMASLALAQGAVFVCFPWAPVFALGVWWNSNTIAHNFLHRPFFRSRAANSVFAAYLSVLVGIPQRLWRDRHLAHHRGAEWVPRLSSALCIEVGLVLSLWCVLAARAPGFFARVYLPGYLAGLALCWLHGHYEHARGTTSHYGRLYNVLCFRDGYHVEHHARPGVHWTRLTRDPLAQASRWPAPVRWLDGLERVVLRFGWLQRWVVRAHARAFSGLDAATGTIGVVGGGLFPRTAMVAQKLWPGARVTLIDADRDHLEEARRWVQGVEFVHARYSGAGGFDAVVIPLAYDGDREAIYARPPAPLTIVHDWIWRRRGESRVVSWLLLKRLNVVRR